MEKHKQFINKICAIIFCLTIILFFLWVGLGHAGEIPREKAIYAIIGEFENDNMLAGACTIRNRGTLKGVYGINSKRVKNHLYSPKTFVKAVKAWEESRKPSQCQMVQGADHWQSVSDMKKPQSWRNKCVLTYKTDKTSFFRCKR